jgi:broad specificity phosphatase PhoE
MQPRKLICLVRHSETEWSLNGRHTGKTDIALTENGRRMAMSLKSILGKVEFSLVLKSPMQRASETCDLAGLGGIAKVDNDLLEWNYGEYEGLTPAQIHDKRPGWMIFRDGCPGGETPGEIGVRVDRLISKVHDVPGNVAFFGHGHLFRVFAARWIGLRVLDGCRFLLEPATLNVLGYYMGIPAIRYWNFRVH